ncbi:MAG: histidine phosphatase family protein [Acidimicrobiales bacterium]
MILLLRHGRTEANAGGLLLGRDDPELDHEGQRQALALAATVRAATGGRVARVVSSPLARCRQTAEAVATRLGSAVTVDERWIELDYGELEGTPTAMVSRETWVAWTTDLSWAPQGGESLAVLGERVRAACEELAWTHGVPTDPGGPGRPDLRRGGDDVVVVTHVSPIKAAVAWALGVGDEVAWRLFVAPASITRIAVSGARRSLHSFNEIAHLD